MKSSPLRFLLITLVGFSLTGCMIAHETQHIKSDGSAEVSVNIQLTPQFEEMLKQNGEPHPFEKTCDEAALEVSKKDNQTLISCTVVDGKVMARNRFDEGYYDVEDKDQTWLFTFPENWEENMVSASQDEQQLENAEQNSQILKLMGFDIKSELTFPGKIIKHSIGKIGRRDNILLIDIEAFSTMDKRRLPTVEIAKSARVIRNRPLRIKRNVLDFDWRSKRAPNMNRRTRNVRGSNRSRTYMGSRVRTNAYRKRRFHHSRRPSQLNPTEMRYFDHHFEPGKIPKTRFDVTEEVEEELLEEAE